jgi:hypothetical protein
MPKAKAAPLERRTIAVSIRLFREIRQRAGSRPPYSAPLPRLSGTNQKGGSQSEQNHLQTNAEKNQPVGQTNSNHDRKYTQDDCH